MGETRTQQMLITITRPADAKGVDLHAAYKVLDRLAGRKRVSIKVPKAYVDPKSI